MSCWNDGRTGEGSEPAVMNTSVRSSYMVRTDFCAGA